MKKMQNSKEVSIVNAIKNSKGRFFGLTMKDGSQVNAQYSYDTPKTVVIYDRNNDNFRRLNKSSIKGLRMGSVQIA